MVHVKDIKYGKKLYRRFKIGIRFKKFWLEFQSEEVLHIETQQFCII